MAARARTDAEGWATGWRWEPPCGRLRLTTMQAVVDVRRLDGGFAGLQFSPTGNGSPSLTEAPAPLIPLPVAAHLFGLDSPAAPETESVVGEAYLRGSDLVAIYPESPACRLRRLVYWRTLADAGGGWPGVELHVAVQTSDWEARPDVAVVTRLPCGEAVRLAALGGRELVPLAGDGAWQASDGPGAAIFRGEGWSLVWLVHPADFRSAAWKQETVGGAAWVRVRTPLFEDRLEKGVLYRGRLRAIVVPSGDDAAWAAEGLAAFAESPLPLTT